MALITRLLVVLLGAAFPLLFLSSSPIVAAGELGVSYGRVANDLPDSASVVQLLKDNGITMVRIYHANPSVLTSLANENLADVASSSDSALQWVKSNVAAYYPATKILVPAMTNVQKALAQLNLADNIKVTTPIAFNAVQSSWPPSSGTFRDDIAEPVMKPMLQFLEQTGSYLSVNIYPYLTYMAQPNDFTLDYVLGNSNPGVVDPKTNLKYSSLLDAQLDATYSAMDKLGASKMDVHHTEHGTPTGGSLQPGGGGRRRLLQAGGVATVANAQTYINNLMNRVLSGNTGTPLRPSADMNVYIFALFNEDQKGAGANDVEQHFGLFYPNMKKVYGFDFRGTVTPPPTPGAQQSWCVANAGVGDARLQAALDYACGHGADCSAIQSGGSCFLPDTKLAHATYAFNSYYQAKGRITSACDFSGAASIVHQAPDMCSAATSWCVANAAVGDARLQAALDYACGNGADCSAIQSGGKCFQPDTKASHASYAFNSYYQRKKRASGTCDFSGAGSVVYQQPKVGNCVLPSTG